MFGDEPRKCEAGDWPSIFGEDTTCDKPATHMESWYDEEGLEVWLCDEHARN